MLHYTSVPPSLAGGRAGDGTVEGPQEALGQAGDLAVCRSRLALAPADVCHAAIAVAVARFLLVKRN